MNNRIRNRSAEARASAAAAEAPPASAARATAAPDPERLYWEKKREALILEIVAIERHMLPGLANPIYQLLESKKGART